MNLDFFNNIKNSLAQYFQPAESMVGNAANAISDTFLHQNKPVQLKSPVPENNTLTDQGKLNYVARNQRNEQAAQQQQANPQPSSQPPQTVQYPSWLSNAPTSAPQASPSPTPQQAVLAAAILAGMNRFSSPPPPIATLSSELAQAGHGLPDPYLPAIISLMETGGMRNMATPNNPFNIGPSFSYPSPQVAITGGGPNNQRGLVGVLNGGLYNDYLQSGDLADFFNKFTPPGAAHGNPTLQELLDRYNSIRSLFTQ